jgi:hypothetical protein
MVTKYIQVLKMKNFLYVSVHFWLFSFNLTKPCEQSKDIYMSKFLTREQLVLRITATVKLFYYVIFVQNR